MNFIQDTTHETGNVTSKELNIFVALVQRRSCIRLRRFAALRTPGARAVRRWGAGSDNSVQFQVLTLPLESISFCLLVEGCQLIALMISSDSIETNVPRTNLIITISQKGAFHIRSTSRLLWTWHFVLTRKAKCLEAKPGKNLEISKQLSSKQDVPLNR